MFQLKLYDRKGNELHLGDIVKVSDGRRISFFAEVKYLPEEQTLTPFHTFSFHSFEKVDKIPEDAVRSTEPRYGIWYLPGDTALPDSGIHPVEDYLMQWRQCEHNLDKRMWRVVPVDFKQ